MLAPLFSFFLSLFSSFLSVLCHFILFLSLFPLFSVFLVDHFHVFNKREGGFVFSAKSRQKSRVRLKRAPPLIPRLSKIRAAHVNRALGTVEPRTRE